MFDSWSVSFSFSCSESSSRASFATCPTSCFDIFMKELRFPPQRSPSSPRRIRRKVSAFLGVLCALCRCFSYHFEIRVLHRQGLHTVARKAHADLEVVACAFRALDRADAELGMLHHSAVVVRRLFRSLGRPDRSRFPPY